MKTIREVIELSTDYLKKKGIDRARYEAECLLADLLQVDRLQLYLEFDRPLSPIELTLCRERLQRRAKGEPLQYIKGELEFYGLRLKVNSNVLIPRQETEILVDLIVKEIQEKDLNGKVLWDLCSGSGCIGLALKKTLPDLQVILSDLSSEALRVAQENAQSNSLDVSFLQGDLFAPFKGKKAHFIVCNPPYISQQEFETLDKEVKDFEPNHALVSGLTGLEFYHRIAQDLKDYLIPGGNAWFEIGHLQGESVLNIFRAQGWSHCRLGKDLAGHDRFIFLENE